LYGSLDDDIGLTVLQCTSGGYLVSGVTKNFFYGDDKMYLLKLTDYGDTTWTKVTDNPNVEDGLQISLKGPDYNG
jgi:hypothetical protein